VWLGSNLGDELFACGVDEGSAQAEAGGLRSDPDEIDIATLQDTCCAMARPPNPASSAALLKGMRYAIFKGREVDAVDLSHGDILRSNDYACICCGKHVSYVSASGRAKPHFRHGNDASCIDQAAYKEAAQVAKDRIENQSSAFHKTWQSYFVDTEVRIVEQGTLHVADIYLQSDRKIRLLTDNGFAVFRKPRKRVVIEIQHSVISAADAAKRQKHYVTKDRALLWIFDVSHIEHVIERYVTLTQDAMRILFPKQQHTGLVNVIKQCGQSTVLLDTGGDFLFKVTRVHLGVGFTYIAPLSKRGLFQQLKALGVALAPVAESLLLQTAVADSIEPLSYLRNYKDLLGALDLRYRVDVDDLVNMMEDIPVAVMQKNRQKYQETYINEIIGYLTFVSNRDDIVYSILKIWLSHVRNMYYCHDSLSFGKHKNVPLCNVPIQYIRWILRDDVHTGCTKKLLELIDISDCYRLFYETIFYNNTEHSLRTSLQWYRFFWDKRMCKDRLPIFQSLIQRPWMTFMYQVPKPDNTGFVHNQIYTYLDCNNREPRSSGPNPHVRGDQDDYAYLYSYKPCQVGDTYIAIRLEDLYKWYITIDEYYKYDFHDFTCDPTQCPWYQHVRLTPDMPQYSLRKVIDPLHDYKVLMYEQYLRSRSTVLSQSHATPPNPVALEHANNPTATTSA
jgi:uncharacterized protein (DUF3820 family)